MVVLRVKEWLTSRLWFKLVFVIAINVFYILDLIYKLYYRPYLTFQPHGGFYGLTGGYGQYLVTNMSPSYSTYSD